MDMNGLKPNLLSNILVCLLSFVVLVFLARFAYVITVKGTACDSAGDICFFAETLKFNNGSSSCLSISSTTAVRLRNYYSSVFQDLIAAGFLSADFTSLCIDTLTGQDVMALRDLGVTNSIRISKKPFLPLVRYGDGLRQPFDDNAFDFEVSDVSGLDRTVKPAKYVSEVVRTLKHGGFFVVHNMSKDQ